MKKNKSIDLITTMCLATLVVNMFAIVLRLAGFDVVAKIEQKPVIALLLLLAVHVVTKIVFLLYCEGTPETAENTEEKNV